CRQQSWSPVPWGDEVVQHFMRGLWVGQDLFARRFVPVGESEVRVLCDSRVFCQINQDLQHLCRRKRQFTSRGGSYHTVRHRRLLDELQDARHPYCSFRLKSKNARMNGARSPSRMRSTSPTSSLVRWSFTNRYGCKTYDRIWEPKSMSSLESSSFF